MTVFVEEERSDDGETLLGTFTGYVKLSPPFGRGEQVSGLSLSDVLDWARSRSGLVLARYGLRSTWWSAGLTPHWSYPAWPPPDMPVLVRRPAPTAVWRAKDFAADGGVQWAVTLWLQPANLWSATSTFEREQWRIDVALAAATCRASWDSNSIDAFLEDMPSERNAGAAFFTMHPPAFCIYFVVDAITASEAVETTQAASQTPDGYSTWWTARPADLDQQ